MYRILLLSFYYPPDLCPGSFRAQALVKAILAVLPKGSHLDVVTTMPNRYSRYAAEASAVEEHSGLTIHRIGLPMHDSGMIDQSRAFLTYGLMALKKTESQRYDLVIATSSRLMTAVLGAGIARKCGARLYLDIRDIFSDTINDVLPKKLAIFVKPLVSLLEGWAINRADRVNLVSAGFANYFSERYPKKNYTFFSNGIDEEFLSKNFFECSFANGTGHISVLYAGNIGEGQGLHLIIPQLAIRMRDRVRFIVIGDGGRRAALERTISSLGIDNVELIPPMKRSDLIEAYGRADVLFVHLNSYDAFKKVLPSKLFEYASTGKPIWAGIDGYAASFVAEEIDNAQVFFPCDVEQAEAAFNRLFFRVTDRSVFVRKFSRDNIVNQMAKDIRQLLS